MLKTLALACTGASLVGASHLRTAAHVAHAGPSAEETSADVMLAGLCDDAGGGHWPRRGANGGAHLLARLDGIKAQNLQARARLEQSCVDFETVSKEKRKAAVNVLDVKKAAWASPGGGDWPEVEGGPRKGHGRRTRRNCEAHRRTAAGEGGGGPCGVFRPSVEARGRGAQR